MVPADQYHQSLDTGPAAVTDAPIRTPAAARETAPATEATPAAPEGTTAPDEAASRGDPSVGEGAEGEAANELGADAENSGIQMPDAGASEAGSSAEARSATSDPQGAGAADAEGKGDPTVQFGDRPGGLEGGEDEDSGEQPQTGEDAAAAPDFTGKLRGQDVTLPGVKTEPLTYTKRAEADLADLRKKFGNTTRYDAATEGANPRPVADNRSNFLKGLGADPTKLAQLKDAGISDQGIKLMQDGKLPSRAWQVHHKLPLDDGGTNSPDNLVLIKNDPFHQVITNEQNALTRGLNAGETKQIDNWPVPDGFVYPPVPPATP
jgi:hypothetical protein